MADDYITIDTAVSCADAVLGLSAVQKKAYRRYLSIIPAMRIPKYDPDEFFSAERQLTKKLTKEKRKLTNFDMIHSMNTEELVAFMLSIQYHERHDRYNPFPSTEKEWNKWLQQEVEQ